MPNGSPVALLSTVQDNTVTGQAGKLLVVRVVRLQERSPAWGGVHLSVAATMSSVDLCLHQDAILDLARDASQWITKLQHKTSRLLGAAGVEEGLARERKGGGVEGSQSPVQRLVRHSGLKRLSRQNSSDANSGSAGRSASRPRPVLRYRCMMIKCNII